MDKNYITSEKVGNKEVNVTKRHVLLLQGVKI
jgi:hypothetical protein